MFTGIITDVGTVRSVQAAGRTGDMRMQIATAYDLSDIATGASIACSGACLTVVEKGTDWFGVDVSRETLTKTVLGQWSEGTRVNLERPLRLHDELGGHMVLGHVDGVGKITAAEDAGGSLRITVEAPDTLRHYIASKGSIAIDGVSLTVNALDGKAFGINIIPHTQDVTTLGELKVGARVNLEVDILARYLERLMNDRTN